MIGGSCKNIVSPLLFMLKPNPSLSRNCFVISELIIGAYLMMMSEFIFVMG